MSTEQFDVTEFYGEKELRWYQSAARNQTVKAISLGSKRILIKMPTGAGKTVTVACLLGCTELKEVLGIGDRALRVLFVAHTNRLLTQADRTFAADNNVELILQSMMSEISEDVLNKGWDITVIDECHHEACVSFQYRLENMQGIGSDVVIGLTATDQRSDGYLIKFDHIVEPLTRQEAVEQGYLAETYLTTIVDGSEKSKAEVVIDILDNYAHQMNGTLIFVRTKKEVTLVHEHLIKLGYKSVGLLDQSAIELDRILDEFSEGKHQFIVSCKKISEGCDVSGANTVVLGLSLGSYTLLNQMVGRAARPDCPCNIYEIINPLAKDNLDTTVICTPIEHKLVYRNKGQWIEEFFDYSSI